MNDNPNVENNESATESIVDLIFGELNLDQLKSKIDELSYFTDVIDEKISTKYFSNAKSVSELWMSSIDLFSLEFELDAPQFENTYNKFAEYLKTLYEHDFCNFAISVAWINKQTFKINDRILNGSEIIARLIMQNKISMNMLHAFNDASNNLVLNKFSKLNNVHFQFISGNFKISFFVFDLIAKKYMEK